ncbi:hypothetical protein [Yersinia enterocolitica]|uniref:hypothetical protein n=1 Tax=Yersinia enterocolitica TaxID=630 RepID=UPI00065A824A|nr:hypothetical protein [Yersinia enterocolitica]CRY10521.1 Uncharacterised protein [Yersinia enterocolitica]
MKIKTSFNGVVLAIASLLISFYSSAKTLNALSDYPMEVTTIINDIKNDVVMVKSFNVEISGCDVHEKMMKIEKITMDSDDRYPDKMTFSDMNNVRISMPTNFSSLDNASRSWVDGIFSDSDWVYVQYSMCGSGGFPQMTAISKHSKRFPQAGITINKEK